MNILIIGLGSIARKHIDALKTLNVDAKIFALRSNPNACWEEGIINIYSLDELNLLVDFAIISNPSNLHAQYIEILAQKEIPLFIEKPAVTSMENVEGLINLIDDKNLITYVACNLRFHPCISFLKKYLQESNQRINEVNVYCGSYLPDWRPGKDFRRIYSANASMGGGVHLDLFHELDYTTWLFGFPIESNSIARNVSGLQIDAKDYANYCLEYKEFTANVILNYYRRKPKREIEIVFHNETITIDLIKNEIRNDADEFLLKVTDFSILDTYSLQLKYFMDCLEDHKQPMNSFKESILNLKICLNND